MKKQMEVKMKKLSGLFTVLAVAGLLISCGSEKSESEGSETITSEVEEITGEDIREAAEAVEQVTEQMKKSKQAAEENKGLTVEEFGLKALKAVHDVDVETVKGMIPAAMAINIDKSFIENEKEEYLQDWDGQVKGVKYRKAQLTGTPQAVIYYDDKNDQEIKVHILDRIADSWYAMGGAYGFEEISKEEFESYESELQQVQ